MLFNRFASSTIISGTVFEGSKEATFFFKSSAEFLMIPNGLRISWEIPATISPNDDKCSARLSCSFRRNRSRARF